MISLWLESIQKHWNDNDALDMIKMKLEHYTGRKVHFFGKRKSEFFIVWANRKEKKQNNYVGGES